MPEQRKFERLPARLEVEIRTRGRGQVCPSLNVSRHGMFLTTANPPHERQLLILRIPLPEGAAIDVMASVVRRVVRDIPGVGPPSGMGINFFALTEENKERWEAFLAQLRGETPRSPEASLGPHAQRPTFLLQPKDAERLRLFQQREFALGSMFLRTPVLRQLGEVLKIVLLHPVSDEEFPLRARVRQIQEGGGVEPKGMTLDFEGMDAALREAFGIFVERGSAPPLEPEPPADSSAAAAAAPRESSLENAATTPPAPTSSAAPTPAPSQPSPPPPEAAEEPIGAQLAEAAVEGSPVLDPEAPSSREDRPPSRELPENPAPDAPPSGDSVRFENGLHATPPELDRAIERLHEELRVEPDDVGALFRLGAYLSAEPHTAPQAISLLQRLLLLEPHHPLANGVLAVAYAQLGEGVAARRHLSRARRLGQPLEPQLARLVGEGV